MKSKYFPRLGSIAVVLCILMPAQASALEPVQISVKSNWQGLGDLDGKTITAITIVCDDEACKSELGPVARGAVDAFIASFQHLPVSGVTLHDIGITEESLHQLATATRQKIESDAYIRAYTPRGWLRAFEQICFDIDRVSALVDAYYRPDHFWTDDYPSVRGEVTVGRLRLSFNSSAQQAFMIPWTIRMDSGKKRTTYDVTFSRALAALLPARFANRERISGSRINAWLESQIRNEAFREVAPPR